jgi:hypothetical protein
VYFIVVRGAKISALSWRRYYRPTSTKQLVQRIATFCSGVLRTLRRNMAECGRILFRCADVFDIYVCSCKIYVPFVFELDFIITGRIQFTNLKFSSSITFKQTDHALRPSTDLFSYERIKKFQRRMYLSTARNSAFRIRLCSYACILACIHVH